MEIKSLVLTIMYVYHCSIVTLIENFDILLSQAPGDLEASDLDDDELDSYILSEKETMSKDKAWNEINADYLKQQQGVL